MQRCRSLGREGRTHADLHQAVVGLGGGERHEGQQYEVQRSQAERGALEPTPMTASLWPELPVPTHNSLPTQWEAVFATTASKLPIATKPNKSETGRR
jgi:hypothetical protein